MREHVLKVLAQTIESDLRSNLTPKLKLNGHLGIVGHKNARFFRSRRHNGAWQSRHTAHNQICNLAANIVILGAIFIAKQLIKFDVKLAQCNQPFISPELVSKNSKKLNPTFKFSQLYTM
jgi:hypothetical protein